MPIRKIIQKFNREDIVNKKYMEAFLNIALDLENVLFTKLLLEKNINASLISRWTLGKYIEWNLKLKLIDEKHTHLLKQFNKVRNFVFHKGRGALTKIIQDPNKMDSFEKFLIKMCDLLDEVEINYPFDQKREDLFSEAMEKIQKDFEKIFDLIDSHSN